MNKLNLSIPSLTASLVLAGSAIGADFNERMAAWQSGGPPAARRMAAPAAYTAPPPAAAAAPAPAQRVLAENYETPASPMVHGAPASNCATCGPGGGPGGGYPGFIAEGNPGWNCGPACGPGCGPCAPFGGLFSHLFCGGCNSCGGFNGCGPCNGNSCGGGACGACGDYGEAAWCNNTMVWARFDVLLWWKQGRDYPVLVTSDSVIESSTTAGILPDAQTLFGGQRDGNDLSAGGRFDIGWWCDPNHCTGYGWRFFGLGSDTNEFNIDSNDNPILAIPFTDNSTDTNDALLVAYPSLRTGSISVRGTSGVVGNDLYGRYLLCRDPNSRIDFLTGWHYNRISDTVEIRSSSTVTETGGSIPVGTVSDIRDEFRARSEFNGGILGLMWTQECGCWNMQWLARMSLGNMHKTMRISGDSTITVPNQTPTTSANGLFSANSNAGQYSDNEFTAITEAGLTFNYRFAPCTQLSVGYTFIYWNNMVAAADGIDTRIGSGDEERPRFEFRHSDFWVQGVNLGLTHEF